MSTQLVYRVEHREHRTGPWSYPLSWCHDSFLAAGQYNFPLISYDADRPDWKSQRRWGFRSIAQCLAYFPRFAEAGAQHDMVLGVYEAETNYVSWDHTQLVFHRRHAIRLIDIEPQHLPRVAQMTAISGDKYREHQWWGHAR